MVKALLEEENFALVSNKRQYVKKERVGVLLSYFCLFIAIQALYLIWTKDWNKTLEIQSNSYKVTLYTIFRSLRYLIDFYMSFLFLKVLIYFIKQTIHAKEKRGHTLKCFNKFVILWIRFLFLNHFVIRTTTFIFITCLTYLSNREDMADFFT